MINKKYSILTDKQKLFLAHFKKNSTLSSTFYLTGGTALAEFYLQHRLSEDLDFFSENKFDTDIVYEFSNKIKTDLQAKTMTNLKSNGREIFELKFDSALLKVEFVYYPYINLKPLKKINDLYVNDLFDISVNKIFAVFSRNETKDFVDLYFLLKKYSLNKLLAGVEKKFGIKLSPFSLGNEFYKAKNITMLPKMINNLSAKQLTDFYKDQARKLGGIFIQ
ncbi:hypothetical protein A3D78_04100 [Candidatus Gottesmanbacteria bacterium RIFCSPHIGHO2_02_FULL_39_14]|uniref:Nucleotidyl transferase AbiEii/AbiGii toxin family protein n=2 Tax=Candidatus Gottesmaniibacteriota TaxID=1752720 RepID=A0A1F5ZZ98_9BACT|nr:MAG: hypothetical protein A3D78_04100 [Candidatus Gottesmanbacteria bacterium RIFCSPHIGHO2_02_FULL_39_14]OGG31284.1 MAG: hypothetical protein A3I51_02380 [Candidatus Gottesmanbacteria bacterium RIFCSPLOWO2_02_FULL_38_8]